MVRMGEAKILNRVVKLVDEREKEAGSTRAQAANARVLAYEGFRFGTNIAYCLGHAQQKYRGYAP